LSAKGAANYWRHAGSDYGGGIFTATVNFHGVNRIDDPSGSGFLTYSLLIFPRLALRRGIPFAGKKPVYTQRAIRFTQVIPKVACPANQRETHPWVAWNAFNRRKRFLKQWSTWRATDSVT
jgi:hypothetical protein